MARFFALLTNISYKLRLPMPGFLLGFVERYLWNHTEKIKVFLTAVYPGAVWKIADKKLLLLVNHYVKVTPALQDIKAKFFPGRRFHSVADFKQYFPILDKDNFRKQYPIEALAQSGRLPHAGSFYKSAGTSGHPTLWVESIAEELEFDKAAEFIARTMLDMISNEYVILNCWALGSWPTGVNFFASARLLGKIVNLGTNVKETLEALKLLGPQYHYLLVGYPPFVYHIIHACKDEGIDLASYKIDVITGGEGFVEPWRDRLIEALGAERSIFSAYGSTDKGLGEGLETNLAYAVRSLMHIASTLLRDEIEARRVMKLRFGKPALPFNRESAKEFLRRFIKDEKSIDRVPMIFQFNPMMYYEENFVKLDPAQNREVYEFLTTTLIPEVTIPRIRYNIHDEGYVMTYDEVMGALQAAGIDIFDFNPRRDRYMDLRLPFLLLFGRSDGTVSVDGANIFPEDIEECLRQHDELFSMLNSFQLYITTDYRFGIALELIKDMAADEALSEKFRAYLTGALPKFSLGYSELSHEGLPSANIAVETYPYEAGPFSNRTIKLRYVRS
ncbi:MAG: hypothetical protein UY71_C0009G0005 [Parcubacteria group bacterium GW2011_GWB1_52_7]|nr:MAG: hypothetical protein UY64_C0004G0002 [Parcubacteria group bacterium GW2011_GWA1_51_12]KKW28845.1 MAG: hypothetical protein UY71_C0009G0005 [Parcubacteria group bacterium GW2011_GWB1_52_7]